MVNQIILLASELYKDKFKQFPTKEPLFNHCRRMAQQAIRLNWEDEVIYGCYLHEALRLHYHNYYEVYEKIKKLDPVLADLIAQVTCKHTETFRQYVRRCSEATKAGKIVLLDLTEEIFEYPKGSDERKIIVEYLPLFFDRLV